MSLNRIQGRQKTDHRQTATLLTYLLTYSFVVGFWFGLVGLGWVGLSWVVFPQVWDIFL